MQNAINGTGNGAIRPEPKPVTNVSIAPTKVELKTGEKAILTATIDPSNADNKEITWESSNVVSVVIGTPIINSDGTVKVEITAVSMGNAIITAKSKNGENGKEVVGTCEVEVKPVANYGTSIQSKYEKLYTIKYPRENTQDVAEESYTGNIINRSKIYEGWNMVTLNKYKNGNNEVNIFTGTNTINCEEYVSNVWVQFEFLAAGRTVEVYISDLKLNFEDGVSCSVKEAIERSYVEPLVLYYARSTNVTDRWVDFEKILDGGQSATARYPWGFIILKVKNKSKLKGCSFYTNKDWVAGPEASDRVVMRRSDENFEISVAPL